MPSMSISVGSLLTYTGLFSHTQGSFDMICGFVLQVSFHMYRSLYQVSIRIYRSLFTYAGLFSHIQVSFHIYRSLFAYAGLFSQTKVSIRIYRAFLTYSSHTRIRVAVSYHIELSLFHICRSLSTESGLYLYIQVSICIYRPLQTYTRLFRVAVSYHMHKHVNHEALRYRSLFAYAGLFSHIHVSLESQSPIICTNMSIMRLSVTGLFLHMQVSFHICRSLFTCTGLF